jgi:hypothetical protein
MSDYNSGAGTVKKADLLIIKADDLARHISQVDTKLTAVSNEVAQNSKAIADITSDRDIVVEQLAVENEALRKELHYLAVQVESVYTELLGAISDLSQKLDGVQPTTTTVVSEAAPAQQLDIDELSSRVAEKIIIPRAAPAEIDIDALAEEVAKRIQLPEGANSEEIATLVAEKVNIPTPTQNVDVDYDALGHRIVNNMVIPAAVTEEIDYDMLADKLARYIPAQEVISPDYIASKVAEQIIIPQPQALPEELLDVEQLSQKIADKVVIPQTEINKDELIDVEELSQKVAEKIVIPAYEQQEVAIDEEYLADTIAQKLKDEQALSAQEQVVSTIDEEALAENIASRLNDSLNCDVIVEEVVKAIPNAVDSQEIADCVAKKIGSITPEQFDVMVDDDGCNSIAQAIEERIDYDVISNAVAEKLAPSIVSSGDSQIDTDELAKELSDKIVVTASVNEDALAEKAAAILSNYTPEIDSDEIADKVASQVIPHLPAAEAIDYDTICSTISEKIVESQEDKDFDIVIDEEGLARLTDSISSEINAHNDELFANMEESVKQDNAINADRVKLTVIEEIYKSAGESDDKVKDAVYNSVGDSEGRIKEAIYNTVGDSEGRISESVANAIGESEGRVKESVYAATGESEERITTQTAQSVDAASELLMSDYEQRLATLEDKLREENQKLLDEMSDKNGQLFDEINKEIEELRNMIASGAVVHAASELAATQAVYEEKQPEESEEANEDTLVTVSDLVDDVEEEAEPEEGEEGDVIDDIVDDIDESPADGEVIPDGIPGISGGVDFASMMKYNRSFIARIIQGSDEQKGYYGEVKTALLSYKKVNSNIAWGAERFNKGRETIARFKIRGKTLCLYLALDPNEYKTSVYHHLDVSDNKSMHGTPMMVKIKSPRGVKKAIRLIDDMLEKRNGIKQKVFERDYAAMYPYETIDELIEDGLVKDVSKK